MDHQRFRPIYLHFIHVTLGLVLTLPDSQATGIQQTARYQSALDEALTVRSIAVLPATDNSNGIYARPLQETLTSQLENDSRFNLVSSSLNVLPAHALDLEESPALVQKLLTELSVDAAILPVMVRGQGGLSIRLSLLLKSDGRMLAQEIEKDFAKFEIGIAQEKAKVLLARLLSRLPYDGLVLSRTGNDVTLGLGSIHGLKEGQTLSIVQIVSAQRHPKFGFLVSTDKDIIGQVRVGKAEESLSFASIVSEKERGAISRFAKVSGLRPVIYDDPEALKSNQSLDSGASPASPGADTFFGADPKEWLPVRDPAFGQVTLGIGLGSYSANTQISGGPGFEAKSDFFPMIQLGGELWINPQWSAIIGMTQGVLTTDNPRGGSTPSQLNHSLSEYSIAAGYNVLIRDEFFGPKLQLRAGLHSYRMFVDDSTPTALTTVSFFGYLLGIGLYFPVDEDKKWALGGSFNLILLPKLSETPVTSGANSTNSVTRFDLFLERQLAVNIKARGGLDFGLYSASLSGSGTRNGETASSISQRTVAAIASLVYQF